MFCIFMHVLYCFVKPIKQQFVNSHFVSCCKSIQWLCVEHLWVNHASKALLTSTHKVVKDFLGKVNGNKLPPAARCDGMTPSITFPRYAQFSGRTIRHDSIRSSCTHQLVRLGTHPPSHQLPVNRYFTLIFGEPETLIV